MAENSLSLVLARLDFGWITTLHILYPPLTIGLAALLFTAEAAWLRTDDERWYRLVRFFERLLIINFAAGVATGAAAMRQNREERVYKAPQVERLEKTPL